MSGGSGGINRQGPDFSGPGFRQALGPSWDLSPHPASVERSWKGENVDVSSIKSALVEALRELRPPVQAGQGHPPIRTSLLTRIVHLPSTGEGERASEALGEVADLHPSRTLIVSEEPNAPAGLDASVTVVCQAHSGVQPQVCSEEVQLTARGDLSDHLVSLVAPLLIPDMPVVFWWFGQLPNEEQGLLQLCDRVVLDSDPGGPIGLAQVKQLVGKLCTHRIVTDLAWIELSPWRELLAQLFDPAEARSLQRTLRSVQLEYLEGAPTSRPYLLLGWLATRLGWTLQPPTAEPGRRHSLWKFQTSAGTVTAKIVSVPAAGGLPPGALLRATLKGPPADKVEAGFAITAQEDGAFAVVQSRLPGQPEQHRVVPLERPVWSSLLSGELDRNRTDPIYQESLEMAASLASRQG